MAHAGFGSNRKRISVRVAAAPTDSIDEEFVESFAIELMNRRSQSGRELGRIYAILVNGRPAAEDRHEGSAFSAGKAVKVSG